MVLYNQSHIKISFFKILRIIFGIIVLFMFTLSKNSFAQKNGILENNSKIEPLIPRIEIQKNLPDSFRLLAPKRNGKPENGINSYTFYKNLEEAASKTYLTKKLHNLLIRQSVELPYELTTGQRELAFQPYSGKIIRKITMKRIDVFGESVEIGEEIEESPFLERIGNSLHIKTSAHIIKRNMLFREGDKLNPETLADNERVLRNLSQIEDARIYVYIDIFQQDIVDVVVITRDYWSKGFDLKLEDVNAGIIEFFNRNFAGLGREIQVNMHFDKNKEQSIGYEGVFKASNLFGTFIDGNIHYMDVFDDQLFQISLSRDFYTPDIKYAGGASFSTISRVDDFIYPDTIYYNSPLKYNSQDYWLGRSFPLKRKGANYIRSGIAISARVQSNIFFDRPPISGNLYYPFHNRNLWLFGAAWTRQNFYRSRYVYSLGHNEDIPIGSILEFTGGIEDNQFYTRWYLGGRIATGHNFEKTGFVFSSISLGTFINGENFEQTILSFENKWFSPLYKAGKYNLRQFAQIRYTLGVHRFHDENLSLSGRYGIRGLRSPEMTGNQKLVFNLETVFYSPANVLGFRFAYFGFADFGWIGSEKKMVFKTDLYGGLGIGLKVRSELMVFPALVIRLAYYPIIPDEARFEHIYLGSEKAGQPDVFRAQQPDIFKFR